MVVTSGIDPLNICLEEQACKRFRQSFNNRDRDPSGSSRMKCPDCDRYMYRIQDYLLNNIDFFVEDLLKGELYCQAPG